MLSSPHLHLYFVYTRLCIIIYNFLQKINAAINNPFRLADISSRNETISAKIDTGRISTDKEVINMSVNGVTSGNSVDYNTYTNTSTGTNNAAADVKAEDTSSKNNSGVVYEKSEETKTDSAKKTYKPNTELVAKLKADAEARTAQMRNLVEKMMMQQGTAFGTANNDSMWKFLAGGNFTVDAATKAKAQADIAEDGYWGVNQTSDRILDFAKALSGGDPDKIEDMKNAFIKGFKQATGTWGKDLPSISSKTYDAVMEKFDKWAEESKKTNTVENATESQA